MIAFAQALFLYFLPFVLLPLLLMQMNRLNPKRVYFPSLELISEILSDQKAAIRRRTRIKQILRMLIVLLFILAFAAPFWQNVRDNKKYILIIDPSISMSVQNLRSIQKKVSGERRISSSWFGEIPWEEAIEKKSLPYIYDDIDAGDLINRVEARVRAAHILFVSDGQVYEFQKRWKKPSFVKSLDLILLQNHKHNLAVKSLTIMPPVAVIGQKTRLLIRLNQKPEFGERMKITLNGKKILDAKAALLTTLSRFIDNKGVNRLEIAITGDDFKPDNNYYAIIPAVDNPGVFIGPDEPVIKGIMETILPDFNKLRSPKFADIVFSSSLNNNNDNKIRFIFSEDKEGFTESVGKITGHLIKDSSAIVTGRPASEFKILNQIDEIHLKTSVILDFGEPLLSVGGRVLATKEDRNVYFAFSIKDNRAELESSVLLLFLINEALNENWRNEFFESGKKPLMMLDTRGGISDGRLPGIYKVSNRYFVNNVGRESEFRFDTFGEIQNNFYKHIAIKALPGSGPVLPSFSIILMLMAFLLLLFEQRY